jgi:hypothetical protein
MRGVADAPEADRGEGVLAALRRGGQRNWYRREKRGRAVRRPRVSGTAQGLIRHILGWTGSRAGLSIRKPSQTIAYGFVACILAAERERSRCLLATTRRRPNTGQSKGGSICSTPTPTNGIDVTGRMEKLPEFDVRLRPERELRDAWGIYLRAEQRWLDLVFTSQREATSAAAALSSSEARAIAQA